MVSVFALCSVHKMKESSSANFICNAAMVQCLGRINHRSTILLLPLFGKETVYDIFLGNFRIKEDKGWVLQLIERRGSVAFL